MRLRSDRSLFTCRQADVELEMSQSERSKAERDALLAGSRIKTMEDLGPVREFRNGTIRDIGLTTMAGYSYAAMVGVPKYQTSNVPLTETTAWFMGLDGYYRHEALSYMGVGNFVVTVGAEGSYHSGTDHGGKIKDISLKQSAAAILNFTKEIVGEYDDLDPETSIVKGASRGAMVGNGIIALADVYSMKVLYADLTAPCFPRPFNPLRDTLGLVNFMANEPQTLVNLGFQTPLTLARRYNASIDFHPASFVHQIAITGALFSGEAGELARSIDPNIDPQMHVSTFGNDLLSMHQDWEEIYRAYAGVRVTPLKGSHLALADKQTHAYQLARNLAFQRQLSAGMMIDAHAISADAHEIVDAQMRVA